MSDIYQKRLTKWNGLESALWRDGNRRSEESEGGSKDGCSESASRGHGSIIGSVSAFSLDGSDPFIDVGCVFSSFGPLTFHSLKVFEEDSVSSRVFGQLNELLILGFFIT